MTKSACAVDSIWWDNADRCCSEGGRARGRGTGTHSRHLDLAATVDNVAGRRIPTSNTGQVTRFFQHLLSVIMYKNQRNKCANLPCNSLSIQCIYRIVERVKSVEAM